MGTSNYSDEFKSDAVHQNLARYQAFTSTTTRPLT